MAGVYFQLKTTAVKDSMLCGIKLTEHADRSLKLPAEPVERKFMTAWLHPDDLPFRRYHWLSGAESEFGYSCVRLEVDPHKCYVGEADLYRLGLTNQYLMDKYLESVVPLNQYTFGIFRTPECLISHSVLDGQIEMLGDAKDIPVLYESSADLYLQNKMGEYEQCSNDYGNALFFSWCRLLESKGLAERFVDNEGVKEIYISKKTGKILVLDIPDENNAELWP